MDSEWWEIAIECVPVVGDIYGTSKYAMQLREIDRKLEAIEIKAKKLLLTDIGSRLGVDPDEIILKNGIAKLRINFSSTLQANDIKALQNYLTGEGAKRIEVESGYIANSKLYDFLERRVKDGKLFHGGTVTKGSTGDNDFTIIF